MKSNAIKVNGNNREFLSVELKNVLDCVIDGKEYKWSILWLEAVGNISDKSILDFEKEIRSSEGFCVDWRSLVDLSKMFDQVIEIVLIGDKRDDNIKRYTSDEEMYSRCQYTFELVDSSYWIIHSQSDEVLTRMVNQLQGVERIRWTVGAWPELEFPQLTWRYCS